MKVQTWRATPEEPVTEPGAQGVHLRVMIGPRDGAENFVLRFLEVEPGGHTPRHRHDWEHEVFIVAGEGSLVGAEGERPLRPGDSVFIAGGEEHQFRNPGAGPFQFICVIPARK